MSLLKTKKQKNNLYASLTGRANSNSPESSIEELPSTKRGQFLDMMGDIDS